MAEQSLSSCKPQESCAGHPRMLLSPSSRYAFLSPSSPSVSIGDPVSHPRCPRMLVSGTTGTFGNDGVGPVPKVLQLLANVCLSLANCLPALSQSLLFEYSKCGMRGRKPRDGDPEGRTAYVVQAEFMAEGHAGRVAAMFTAYTQLY